MQTQIAFDVQRSSNVSGTSRMAVHQAPASLDGAKYALCQRAFMRHLRQRAGNVDFYSDRFNPFALSITPELMAQASRVSELCVRVVETIVGHYFNDSDIRRTIALPSRELELLRLASARPFRVGSLRPDFLMDDSGDLRVCEINARFPTNGIVMSQYVSEVMRSTAYGKRPVPGCLDAVISMASEFDLNRPVSIVRGREQGYDIHLLFDELRRRLGPHHARMVHPEQLSVRDGRLHDGWGPCDQFVLELHQDELMGLPDEVLRNLAESATYFNDIRTILIGHDKRLFAVLSDPTILRRYFCQRDVRDISRFFIPAYLASDSAMKDTLWHAPKHWVLKKYLSGKGEEMYVGRDDSVSTLCGILKHSAEAYVCQPFVEQARFNITTSDRETGELEVVACHVVGLIPSFNGRLLGPGVFRSSVGNVVNVSRRGGDILTPVLSGS